MAIGKNGQNIKLASGVTEYTIDAVKKSEYEGSDESTIYLDEVKGISAKQIEILSKAEIHTTEDYLNTDSTHIIALKGMGVKTNKKLQRVIQEAVNNKKEEEKEPKSDLENQVAPSELEEVENA